METEQAGLTEPTTQLEALLSWVNEQILLVERVCKKTGPTPERIARLWTLQDVREYAQVLQEGGTDAAGDL